MQTQSLFQVYNASAGSGKTFTLVKEYLKIILKDNNFYQFQKILAITFTNKAAGEMKERVLHNLFDFSKQDLSSVSNDMFNMIIEETGLAPQTVQKKAFQILQNILQNYSSFNVQTIDSFTNKLIKSFSFDLGMSMDFEVELDPNSILKETIDVIISKIGIDKELTNVLVAFAKQKTLEDKSWDISRELLDISKLILNEDHVHEIKKLESKSISDFKSLEKKLNKKQTKIEKQFTEIGKKGIEIIANLAIEDKDFYYTDLPNFFKKLIKFNKLKAGELKFEGRLKNSINNRVLYSPNKSQSLKSIIDGVADDLIQLYFKAEQIYNDSYAIYQLNRLILINLIPLAVLNRISKQLEDIKRENNIRLNAEFNQIISNHLKEQPAAFIYEKIGEKFKHFFIDEMQDTSVMQWENLIPLIDNALSQENASALLVGDAKQAIYRWRGGRAEQFIDLSFEGDSPKNNPFQIEKKIDNLKINFRSHAEIISFNNKFFTHISKFFKQESYKNLYKIGNQQKLNLKKRGYVRLKFLEESKNKEEKDTLFSQEVYRTILELDKSFNRNEICILVRKKTQGITIANFLTEKGIEIISSETLLLKNNSKIDFIINLLKYLKDTNNQDAKFQVAEYLFHHLQIKSDKHEFIYKLVNLNSSEFFKYLELYQIYFKAQNFYDDPFYESIEMIVRCFKLANQPDAHIQFFLDFIFDYTQRNSQNNILFLEFWEEKKEKLSIVSSNNVNAVRIMTIHKSKGLEFPVVIFPYDMDIYFQISPKVWFDDLDYEHYNEFKSILVNSSSRLETVGSYGKKLFRKQQEELELDSFNLLYVTLTRAKEQLYIISENKKVKDKIRFFSHLFIDFLRGIDKWEEEKMVYDFGNNKRVSKKEKFDVNHEIQKEFISTPWKDHQINIVVNSPLLYNSERDDAIKFGNLIHELMAGIYTEFDIDKMIGQKINTGLIDKKDLSLITNLLYGVVKHHRLKKYFQKTSKIITEREIVTDDKQIYIPDRLNINKNKVTIIDYKTGKQEKKHVQQIKKYALVLQKMNFEIDEALLVYIDKKVEVFPT